MKKKILVLGMMGILLSGCGKIPTLKNGEEAVVTFKDGKKISANAFYHEIKNSFGLDTLVNMIDKHIYELEFKDEMKNANAYADASIKQLRSSYESDEELLNALRSYGMNFQTVDAYRNSIYLSYLQNEAIESYVSNRIKEEELKEYYENDVYPNMSVSHILVTPNVTDDMEDEEKEKEEKKAKEEIKNIIKELDKAKKDGKDINAVFKDLAKKHSEDDSTKNKGGDLGEINLGSLNSKYDELVKEAAKLKDGEYSLDVITTELGFHVILKTKTGKKASYEDSLDDMKASITENKLTDDKSLIMDAIKHYREKYELDIVDSELDKQYGRYMNNLINMYKSEQ